MVGDKAGRVGAGSGKANSVPDAIHKATEKAKKNMHRISMYDTTIPHEVIGRCGGARVLLKPASRGTGVIAGGGVRAVIGAAGIQDILSKSMGSANILNVIYATMDALDKLKFIEKEAKRRGKPVDELKPHWAQR